MPRSMGNNIADSLELGLGYAERMLVGVTPQQFARLAAPGGARVESNHAAFVYGHLSLYPPQILAQLGEDPSDIAPPESFPEVFSKDATCQDDPDGSIYPEMQEITETFFSGYRCALDLFRTVDDELLQRPNPLGGGMSERFPVLASMHGFYVGGHLMLHLGQVSAWRRMWGLGPA